ncbi:MAG: hypothetical protein JW844_04080 [Candidatus Omnitrophica bacterium]|nr:hypothetical protein [Candidatus Omnitrophota bacterium]
MSHITKRNGVGIAVFLLGAHLLWCASAFAGATPCIVDAVGLIGKDTGEVMLELGSPVCRILLFGRDGYSWEERYERDHFLIRVFYDEAKKARTVTVRFPVLIKSSELAKGLVGFSGGGQCDRCPGRITWRNPCEDISEVACVRRTDFADEGFIMAYVRAKQ